MSTLTSSTVQVFMDHNPLTRLLFFLFILIMPSTTPNKEHVFLPVNIHKQIKCLRL